MTVGKRRRLRRILSDGPAVICPVDDSLLAGPFGGLRDMETLIQKLVRAKPNAILAFGGSLRRYSELLLDTPTILNCTGSVSGANHCDKVQIHTIAEAQHMDADCVAAHFNLTSDAELDQLRLFSKLRRDADAAGLPMMAIAYPRRSHMGKDDNYNELMVSDPSSYAQLVARSVRVAAELGADLIKTHFTTNPSDFGLIVDAAQGVPLFISGGPLQDEESALKKATECYRNGAKGLSFGRNVFERTDPGNFVSRLKSALEHA